MKKHLLPLLGLAMAMLAMVACNPVQRQLKAECEKLNKQMPMQSGYFTIVSAEVIDGKMVMTTMLDEDYVDIDIAIQSPDENKANIITTLQNSQGGPDLLRVLTAANAGLEYVYIGSTSGKSYRVTLTADEIRTLSKNTDGSDPEAFLSFYVNQENANLSAEADEGIIIQPSVLTSDAVVYTLVMDEELYTVSLLCEDKDATKAELLDGFVDFTTRAFAQALVATGRTLSYRYVGNQSGEVCQIDITPADLAAQL